jgi:hypothetical protein
MDMIYVDDFVIEEQLERITIDYTKTNKFKDVEEHITKTINLEEFRNYMLKTNKDIVNSYTETDIADYTDASGDGEVFNCKYINWTSIYEYVTTDIVERFLKSIE